jgi:primary-amine oxidase
MSLDQIATSLPFVGGKKSTPQHPLGPLTASEISESARLIKALWPEDVDLQFKSITLREPDKADLLPFLAAEHSGQATPTVERRSFVVYYLRSTVSDEKNSGLVWRVVKLIERFRINFMKL